MYRQDGFAVAVRASAKKVFAVETFIIESKDNCVTSGRQTGD